MSQAGTTKLPVKPQSHTQSPRHSPPGSPLLPGDDEDVVEEEEVDLLPLRPLEEDAVVLHEGRQLPSLHHPPGGGDQGERLQVERRENVTDK